MLKRDEGLGGGSGLVGVKGAWHGVEVWLRRRFHLSQGSLRLIYFSLRGGEGAQRKVAGSPLAEMMESKVTGFSPP